LRGGAARQALRDQHTQFHPSSPSFQHFSKTKRDKVLAEGPWQQPHLDSGTNLIIPLPRPLGGAVLVGENVLAYVTAGQPHAAIPMPYTTCVRAFGRVDADGSRHLLSDHLGQLYVLALSQNEAGRLLGMKLEPIGQASPAECLAYLDNGVVFIGSSFADSQVRACGFLFHPSSSPSVFPLPSFSPSSWEMLLSARTSLNLLPTSFYFPLCHPSHLLFPLL
jgi:hypothetical protein